MASGFGSLANSRALGELAQASGLQPGPDGYLPKVGSVLTRGVSIDDAVHGTLPGGLTGQIALLRYETHNDDHTVTHRLTAVISALPESIGFAPYLAVGGGGHIGLVSHSEVREVENVNVRVDEGVDAGWLTELISPAFADWLSRSPRDFGFELADGVLVVVRDGHLSERGELESLCADATKIATAIRAEAVEESSSGEAPRTAAKAKADSRMARVSTLLDHVSFSDGPPKDVAAATDSYQSVLRSRPGTYLGSAFTALGFTLVISVIAGGLYGLILNLANPLLAAAIWEGGLYLLIFFLVLRRRINGDAKGCAEEAFYAEYARERGLQAVEPLRYAAENAEAGLPGKPVRVFTGFFAGTGSPSVNGALVLTGDGMERGEWAALVAGRRGPTAKADLTPSAPGISSAYLDEITQTLLLDLATNPAPPARAAS